MTDNNATVVWKGDYKPFGEVNKVIGSVDNNFRFPGQYYDAESGLYYNWNRYYLAGVGRYLMADPIGLDGGLNLYGYVGGDPVNEVDIKGLATYKGCDAMGILGGGLLSITCCDSKGKKKTHYYWKICLGAALGISGEGGGVTNSDGASCDNPPKRLLGVEGSGGLPWFSPGGGLSIDLGGGGSSICSGVGGSIGMPISVMGCYYKYYSTTEHDECCN